MPRRFGLHRVPNRKKCSQRSLRSVTARSRPAGDPSSALSHGQDPLRTMCSVATHRFSNRRPRADLDHNVPFVEHQLGWDIGCLEVPHRPTGRGSALPVPSDFGQYIRAGHAHPQAGEQPLVAQRPQCTLKPAPIPDTERQPGRVELLATFPVSAGLHQGQQPERLHRKAEYMVRGRRSWHRSKSSAIQGSDGELNAVDLPGLTRTKRCVPTWNPRSAELTLVERSAPCLATAG
jgi:hypothetical protein